MFVSGDAAAIFQLLISFGINPNAITYGQYTQAVCINDNDPSQQRLSNRISMRKSSPRGGANDPDDRSQASAPALHHASRSSSLYGIQHLIPETSLHPVAHGGDQGEEGEGWGWENVFDGYEDLLDPTSELLGNLGRRLRGSDDQRISGEGNGVSNVVHGT